MTTLSQNASNDIYLTSDGDFAMSEGQESYGLILADAVRTLRGEIQLDVSIGIPYETTVWHSRGRLAMWKHYVKDTIGRYAFVTGIHRFDASVDDKGVLNYDIVIGTDKGDVTVSS